MGCVGDVGVEYGFGVGVFHAAFECEAFLDEFLLRVDDTVFEVSDFVVQSFQDSIL